MYKIAGRNLQHRHGVDAPKPTGGYIGAESAPNDVIPSIEMMGPDQVRAERDQLRLELRQACQEVARAKAKGWEHAARSAGQRVDAIQRRIGACNQRLHALGVPDGTLGGLCRAIREVADEATAEAIFARWRGAEVGR